MNKFFSLKFSIGKKLRFAKYGQDRKSEIRNDQLVIIVVIGFIVFISVLSVTITWRMGRVINQHDVIITGEFKEGQPTKIIENCEEMDKESIKNRYSSVGLRQINKLITCNEANHQNLKRKFEDFNENNKDWGNDKLQSKNAAGQAVIDALPLKHDHLEMSNRLKDFLIERSFQPSSLRISDTGLAPVDPNPTSQPIDVSLVYSGERSLSQKRLDDLLLLLNNSIRPFKLKRVDINISQVDVDGQLRPSGEMDVTLDFTSYYQPQKLIKFEKINVGGGGSSNKDSSRDNADE